MQLMIGLLNGLCGVSNFLEEVNVPYFKNRLKIKSGAVFLYRAFFVLNIARIAAT